MADSMMSLMPVRVSELVVGQPSPRNIYDWHGKLLLAAGCVVESASQLEGLAESGFIEAPAWDAGAAPRAAAGPMKRFSARPHAERRAEETASGRDVVVALDAVRWTVGETLYLQPVDNSSIRYVVKLIGFVRNKTVLVTAPTVDGKFEFVREGQIFVVRAFSGKRAFAFAGAAVKYVHTPHPYLHLAWPREMRCTLVRKAARAQVKIIASVSLGEAEQNAAAVIHDLSVGGASAIAKGQLGPAGEKGLIKFRVNAAGQDEYMNLHAVLRSVAPAESGDGFRHGFEFVEVTIHDRLILSAFVHQTLVEGE